MIHRLIVLSSLLVLSLLAGCATSQRPIPSSYFLHEHELNVEITKIPENAKSRDSGQGGLIGGIVNMSRKGHLRSLVAGLQGDTIKQIIQQDLESELGQAFIISEDARDVKIVVEIESWGWFVPTTILGIGTGTHRMEVFGRIKVYDMKPEKKKMIAYREIVAQVPVGDSPTADDCTNALYRACSSFAEIAAQNLLVHAGPKETR